MFILLLFFRAGSTIFFADNSPLWGLLNSTFYASRALSLYDTINSEGIESVTKKEVYFGYYSKMNLKPIASISLSMRSKNKFFYHISLGAQFVKTSYSNLKGWYDDKGKFDDFESYLSYDYFNDFDPVIGNAQDSTMEIGPNEGLIIQPILGLGYAITSCDLFLAQFATSSYSIAYQREWQLFSLGLSVGKVHSILANTIQVGPWMKKSTNDFDWLESKSSLLLSA